MDHRLEIPSDTDPEWASMIESCWDRYCFARYWTANSRPCQMIIPSLSKKWLSLCEQWPAMPPLVPRTPWEAPGAAKAERRAGSDATQSSWERCWKDEHQRELASRSRSSSQSGTSPIVYGFRRKPLASLPWWFNMFGSSVLHHLEWILGRFSLGVPVSPDVIFPTPYVILSSCGW
jgi:hypothetical protein